MIKHSNFSLREGVEMCPIHVPVAVSKWHVYDPTCRLCRGVGSFQAPICCWKYRYAPHNGVSFNEGPHMWRWSYKIIL